MVQSARRTNNTRRNYSRNSWGVDREVNLQIEASLRYHATKERHASSLRLRQLEQAWDAEQVFVASASALILSGVVLGALGNRKWLVMPGITFPFLLQYAIQGWSPPMSVIRRVFGVRSRHEIELEKHALRALRGDLGNVAPESLDVSTRVQTAFNAAKQMAGRER